MAVHVDDADRPGIPVGAVRDPDRLRTRGRVDTVPGGMTWPAHAVMRMTGVDAATLYRITTAGWLGGDVRQTTRRYRYTPNAVIRVRRMLALRRLGLSWTRCANAAALPRTGDVLVVRGDHAEWTTAVGVRTMATDGAILWMPSGGDTKPGGG